MSLEIFTGGGYIEREITYEGKDEKEIARMISEDENALMNYMRTGDDLGEKCFVFQGFMLAKNVLYLHMMRTICICAMLMAGLCVMLGERIYIICSRGFSLQQFLNVWE